MAKHYGTRPSALWKSNLGDWSFDLACYLKDQEAAAREQEKIRARAGTGSKEPPAWPKG